MLKKRIHQGQEIEILKMFGMSTSNRKLTWLFDKNAQLRNDYLKLKRTWKQESGKRKVLIWLFLKPIGNLSFKDWSHIKLINGLIKLRGKGSIYVENWK